MLTYKSRIFFLVCILLSIEPNIIFSQSYVRNIFIERKEVFDSTRADWFFAAPLANYLHILTKQYIIEDELLFTGGQEIDDDLLYETERNLRRTGLFSEVAIELDSVGNDNYDAYIVTRDRWSTLPGLLFGTGGNKTNYGAKFEEINLFGTGTWIFFEALHRSENNTGWQGIGKILQKRLFRTEISLEDSLYINRYRTEHFAVIQKPFRTLNTQHSYGVSFQYSFGNDFLFNTELGSELMPFHEKRLRLWYSRAWKGEDRVFVTGLLELDDVNRGNEKFFRAYDNSGKFLIAFSSVSENYKPTTMLNSYYLEDLPIGGWGTATLGKVFPIGSKGEHLYYVGGQGEKSWLTGDLYLFGQLTGASSFIKSNGVYTYQEFLGLGFYRLSEKMLLAARFRQQSVWNWYGLRQLILDNDNGIRGYNVNDLTGDNRIIGNVELRVFPDWQFWILNFSLALFFDTGTVWRQDTHLTDTRWHNSAGFGIRIHDLKSAPPRGIFRLDFAFNFDEGKFGKIIFTTDQLFSVFHQHKFKLPEIYGLEFDVE